MANCSKAYGTLVLTTDTKDHLANLIYLHCELNRSAYYETDFADERYMSYDEIKQAVDKKAHRDPDYPTEWSYEIDIIGTGRWAFSNNILWFLDILNNAEARMKRNDNNDKQLLLFAQQLRDVEIITRWEIKDAEPGFDFICKYDYSTRWDPETHTSEVLYEYEYDCVDYTADNLITYGFYDEGEVFDIGWIRNNYNEFIDDITDYVQNRDEDDITQDKTLGLMEHITNNKNEFKAYLDVLYDNLLSTWVCHDIYNLIEDYFVVERNLSATSDFNKEIMKIKKGDVL